MKIGITGIGGQLGQELLQLEQQYPHLDIFPYTRAAWDITDIARTKIIFELQKFDCLINTAAYTAVDDAEEFPEKALEINGTAVGNLAKVCSENNCKLIHLSTDYVFDGKATEPIREDMRTEPINSYGRSKLAGEEAALLNAPESIIIRTSWLYSSFGTNFLKTIDELSLTRSEISVVDDQQGSPTYAGDLAKFLLDITKECNSKKGIFNFSNKGVTSWYDFATEIIALNGSNCAVKRVSSSHFKRKAQRPNYSVLDTNKTEKEFSYIIPKWQDALARCWNVHQTNIKRK